MPRCLPGSLRSMRLPLDHLVEMRKSCVISIAMVAEAMCLYDGTQWCSVYGEEEGSKNWSLRNASDQLMCFWYLPSPGYPERPTSEIGFKPAKWNPCDAQWWEGGQEDLMVDSVKAADRSSRIRTPLSAWWIINVCICLLRRERLHFKSVYILIDSFIHVYVGKIRQMAASLKNFFRLCSLCVFQEISPWTAALPRWRNFLFPRTSKSATSHATPLRSAGIWTPGPRNASRTTSLTSTRKKTRMPTSSNTRCVCTPQLCIHWFLHILIWPDLQ